MTSGTIANRDNLNVNHVVDGLGPKRRRPHGGVGDAARSGVVSLLVLMSTAGCALHYYDAKTGTEHVWGIGHMAMKVSSANEGVRAVVHGISAVGLAVGSFDAQHYLSVGWTTQQQVEVIDENAAVRLEWPDSSPFNVRVGSSWPAAPDAKMN